MYKKKLEISSYNLEVSWCWLTSTIFGVIGKNKDRDNSIRICIRIQNQ